ncbi:MULTISPECIES: hypothetical protein [Methylosinus]|uniref:Uncharacterized protein n=1 Tax=Methylosinus trichosporium (strain ATCC 35070 / NCIMB 11131 / UNIQEM 75 / OB3b) TaxID=595536 RepID=A0A2D2D022_METT3|nr:MULTISPECIES: hypothetical protein [Methylosinus]ATQ68348.1 hypothetical protein CQW49_10990 [Methylosinus trichosporium OB3b]OBS50914.1 hypothetical protein A8B73_18670 [Methylosinus sp. 3S-1]
MAAITECRIAHQTPKRLRLVVQGKRDRAALEALRERVRHGAPQMRVDVNAATSCVVIHSRDSDGVLEMLKREEIVTIIGEPQKLAPRAGPSPLAATADASLRRWSGGRVDAKSASATLVLMLFLVVKLARGNPASAAMLLLLYVGGKIVKQRLLLERGRLPARAAA